MFKNGSGLLPSMPLLFINFFVSFYAPQIGHTFGCNYYPTNLNSLGHCICVHQGKIAAAAGLEPGTPGL